MALKEKETQRRDHFMIIKGAIIKRGVIFGDSLNIPLVLIQSPDYSIVFTDCFFFLFTDPVANRTEAVAAFSFSTLA